MSDNENEKKNTIWKSQYYNTRDTIRNHVYSLDEILETISDTFDETRELRENVTRQKIHPNKSTLYKISDNLREIVESIRLIRDEIISEKEILCKLCDDP